MKNCHDKHVRNDVRKDFERDDLVMYKNNLKDRALVVPLKNQISMVIL